MLVILRHRGLSYGFGRTGGGSFSVSTGTLDCIFFLDGETESELAAEPPGVRSSTFSTGGFLSKFQLANNCVIADAGSSGSL
mmetsp:Transcript_17468/g.17576  ORF Transcript_17468/g.17576 Transcript_17468/m.17576 type:complete len:82 (+) Transcript_17468:1075-1320(+)